MTSLRCAASSALRVCTLRSSCLWPGSTCEWMEHMGECCGSVSRSRGHSPLVFYRKLEEQTAAHSNTTGPRTVRNNASNPLRSGSVFLGLRCAKQIASCTRTARTSEVDRKVCRRRSRQASSPETEASSIVVEKCVFPGRRQTWADLAAGKS